MSVLIRYLNGDFIVKTLPDLEPLLIRMGSTLKNAANWIERIDLVRNALPATRSGSPRMFSHHEATLMIAMAAIVTAGAKPSLAASIASSIARQVKANGKPSREWLIFKAGDFARDIDLKRGVGTNETDAAKIAAKFGVGPLCFVPIGAIVRLVDDLFSEAE